MAPDWAMTHLPKCIAVLGATGSVGRQALDVAREYGIQVDVLTANRQVEEMEHLVREFMPAYCAMGDEKAAMALQERLIGLPVTVFGGEEGIVKAIGLSRAEVFVNAILGKAGLIPTLAVIQTGKRLALSNKESLVIAGEIVMKTAKETGCEIIPVDSEHSAIFQCMRCGNHGEVKRLILTASGGPFYGYTKEALEKVTVETALNHPTWKMGAKITVDSATLMNKGFEVIEAAHLFGISPHNIQVVVHPQSMIHSAVEYIDNTVIGEMSVPDMRSCIRYALSYPHRVAAKGEALDFFRVGQFSFYPPDMETFPLLALAFRAFSLGGGVPACLNGANEVAVEAFLCGRLSFTGIFRVVEETVSRLEMAKDAHTLEEILDFDKRARACALSLI